MNQEARSICSGCQLPVLSEFYFCPNCGRQLRSKPISVSVGKQIALYLFSFFLSPLGLYFSYKYIKQPLEKTKVVGWVIIVLTLLSIGLSLYAALAVFQQYIQLLNSLGLPH